MLTTEKIFSLGDWQVDPLNSTINNGETIKLDNKIMQLLCFLAEHQGDIVTRDQILDKVWESQFVADDVLNVAVSTLRKSLGDNPKSPKYIKTIPRKGYRLLTPVTFTEQPSTSSTQHRVNIIPNSKPTISNIKIPLLAISILIAFIVGYLKLTPADSNQPTNNQTHIAVLPFEYFGSDEDQTYIADGLTDAIINSLVQQQQLKVISRTTVMTFKDSDKNIKEIGELLNVGWILEGSIQIEQDQLNVTAQLIEVSNDIHQWSSTYQRSADDLFAIQTDIANQIASRFKTSPANAAESPRLGVYSTRPARPASSEPPSF